MFYLTLDFNSDAIFVFPRVDLYNRILISSQNSDLEKSASSTVRPKLWRLCGRALYYLESWNFACDLPLGTHNDDNKPEAFLEKKFQKTHPNK